MSAHHSRFTAVGLKSRATRSGAVRTPGTLIVVRPLRRFSCPASPAERINRSTRLRPTKRPSASRSSACTRGDPYVSPDCVWITAMRPVNVASATALADSGRLAHA